MSPRRTRTARPSRKVAERVMRAALIAGVALGACATTAPASSLSYDGAAIVYSAGDNLNHEVQFRLNGNRDEIIDTEPITSGPSDCTYVVDPTWVSCPGHNDMRAELGSGNDTVTTRLDCFNVYTINLGEGTNSIELSDDCDPGASATVTSGSGQDDLDGGTPNTTFFSGGGSDTIQGGTGDEVLHGGDGNDNVFGNAGSDQIYGEGANDALLGGDGNDLEDGGPGDDVIGDSPGINNDADAGADVVRGGDGADRLVLDGHSGGMAISIDGQANDGTPGEGDNIGSDIEDMEGTKADDVFFGSPGPDRFSGEAGKDEIHGGGGDDEVSGGSNEDRVYGDGGSDKVEGGSSADTVDGGPGTDRIYGDNDCSALCSFDPDTVFARDGERDTVDCGGGADLAHVDGLDIVAFCSTVDRQDVPGQAQPATGPGSAAAVLGLKVPGSIRSKVLLKRGLAFQLKCAGACTIAAELRYKSKKLGKARKTLLKAGSARLVVKVSKKAKRTVRRLKRAKLTLRVKVTDAAGKTTALKRTVTLKR